EVDRAFFQQVQIFFGVDAIQRLASDYFGPAAVGLESAHGRHQHDAVRFQPAVTALDVAELFEAHVGSETGFGDYESFRSVELQRDRVGDNGRISVSDIGERPGVNESRGAFQGLHQGGHDGVAHQHSESAAHADIVRGDGMAVAIGADHHSAEA